MKSILAGLLVFGALSIAGTSSNAVGSVSSPDPFALNDVAVAAKGVPSWPLIGGDMITTSGKPVLVTLGDGTEILVGPNSKVKIVSDRSGTRVEVISGSAEHCKDKKKGWDWCWSDSPAKTSNHRCDDRDHGRGRNDHDRDDRCCPSHH